MKTRLTFLCRLFILAATSIISFPPPASALPSQTDEFVNDFAEVITESVRRDIASKAADVRREHNGAQIVVVTVNSLDGMTIEKYANTLFNTWGLGNRRANNGVLLLIVPRGDIGSRLRIEVGIGLEKTITNGQAGHILDRVLPYYERGDYSTTAAAGFDLIAERIIEKSEASKKGSQKGDGVSVAIIVLDIVISLVAFSMALHGTLSNLFSRRPSIKKVERMGIADGGYTAEDKSIFKNAKKKEGLLWWSSIPAAVIVQLMLRNRGISVNDGFTPLGWLITAAIAAVAAVVYNKIKYTCPKCSAILEYANVVEDEPTYFEKGKMFVHLACHKCGSKYVGVRFIPKKTDGSSYRHHGGGSSFGGGGSGGGGHSRGGGASR